jgi:acetolactate synthase-1/2/3 large subunit
MIQIDIDPAEIGLNYHPWGVVGDPKAALSGILAILTDRGISNLANEEELLKERLKNIEELKEDHRKYRKADKIEWLNSDPIKPQRVLKAISDNMSQDDYLITDASTSARWIGAYFPVKSIGRKIVSPRGVGPTGFGVGALIGTCIAADAYNFENNKLKKVLFTGDGGLMNGGISEFETIKKLDLDCTVVVINNSALGFVKFGQAMLYKHRFYDTDRPQTDFAKIVEAFGGEGIRIERISEIDSAIKEAINRDGFKLVDVVIDPMELLPPNFY